MGSASVLLLVRVHCRVEQRPLGAMRGPRWAALHGIAPIAGCIAGCTTGCSAGDLLHLTLR